MVLNNKAILNLNSSAHAFSPYCSLYTPYETGKENVFYDQKY